MLPIEIEWDGVNLPDEMRQLPPGRYVAYLVDDADQLTEEEEAGVQQALDDAEAGHVIPLDEAIRDIRARAARRDTL